MPRVRSSGLRLPLLIGAALVVGILLYAAVAAYPYIRGPILSVSPITQSEEGTVIEGSTVRVSALTINGLSVPLDEAGRFSAVRAYPPGYTVVTVSARDRFGRMREETLTFITPPYPEYAEESEARVEDRNGTSTEEREEDGGL